MFKRGTRLQSEGREGDKEFVKIRLELHRRLGLKPWQPNIFDLDPDAPVDPHQFYDWKWVAGLRDQLAALAWPRPRLVERRDEAGEAGAEPLP